MVNRVRAKVENKMYIFYYYCRIRECQQIGAMTTIKPENISELQLYRVLERANLLQYYITFINQGETRTFFYFVSTDKVMTLFDNVDPIFLVVVLCAVAVFLLTTVPRNVFFIFFYLLHY